MANYVLIHGAWHGGWCWRRVAHGLRALGHEVFTPSLTGLGDRSHLAGPLINLDTHIDDVVGLFDAEEIGEAVLCGHSYGGLVITGAADRRADRIKSLVYLDAFIPENGQSLFDIRGPDAAKAIREAVSKTGDGWRIKSFTPEYFGVMDPKDAEWVRRRCVDQPVATFGQPISLEGRWQAIRRKAYIYAERYPNSGFGRYVQQVRGKPGWEFHSLPSGHDVMIDMPKELIAILDGLGRG
jgi:pimeloyl-ACP methyl ester carboxylesterase